MYPSNVSYPLVSSLLLMHWDQKEVSVTSHNTWEGHDDYRGKKHLYFINFLCCLPLDLPDIPLILLSLHLPLCSIPLLRPYRHAVVVMMTWVTTSTYRRFKCLLCGFCHIIDT